jgi:hypothetical protein
MRRGLSREVCDRIIELRRKDWTFRRIAWEMKVTPGQVAGVCWRAGLCDPRGSRGASRQQQRQTIKSA